jgi:hypothetical protein
MAFSETSPWNEPLLPFEKPSGRTQRALRSNNYDRSLPKDNHCKYDGRVKCGKNDIICADCAKAHGLIVVFSFHGRQIG